MFEVLTKADAVLTIVYKDYRKMLKSLMVGVGATLVQLAFLFLLQSELGIMALYAYVISYHAGMAVSFTLNKIFTFRDTSNKYHYQLVSFAVVAYSQLILNSAIYAALLYYVFGADTVANSMVSTVIAAFIGFVYAFLLNKSVTFKIFSGKKAPLNKL